MSPAQASARERLTRLEAKLRDSPQTAYLSLAQEIQIHSAIEVTSALIGLSAGVDDLANRVVTVANNLTSAITAATKQAEDSSKESANLAAKSADLSRKLNSLTIWIIVTAFLSAGAAAVQAIAVVYQINHPSPPQLIVTPIPVAKGE
jgi:hypothetical protein